MLLNMYCYRLNHFARINSNGTISRCGHMTNAPQFQSLADMEASKWLKDTHLSMSQNIWPNECIRCKEVEQIGNKSIRQNFLYTHLMHKDSRSDYIVLSGVLDNVCNSACQTCNDQYSTKIGSLQGKGYIKINNSDALRKLPLDRIVQLDINGGEPSASKNYLNLLQNLPSNVRSIRINTNCARIIDEVVLLVDKGIKIIITASLDGIGRIHDYLRWPIQWSEFEKNLMIYQNMPGVEINTWTTVSALNIGDFKNILNYVSSHSLPHSWALLEEPSVLSIKHSNHLTRAADVPDILKSIVASGKDNNADLQAFTHNQDKLRHITLEDYFSK